MTRDDIITRYRRLREISCALNNEALGLVSRATMLGHARRLGLIDGVFFTDCEAEINLAYDLCVHTAAPGRSSALDRLARSKRFSPGSEEAVMLAAMRQSRFSVWEVIGRHDTAGVTLYDAIRKEEVWVVDLGMEASAPIGMELVTRLYRAEDFYMASGAFAPVDSLAILEIAAVSDRFKASSPDQFANDPRFAAAAFRIAIQLGLLENVRYAEPGARPIDAAA